jgi:hypothetical protein
MARIKLIAEPALIKGRMSITGSYQEHVMMMALGARNDLTQGSHVVSSPEDITFLCNIPTNRNISAYNVVGGEWVILGNTSER